MEILIALGLIAAAYFFFKSKQSNPHRTTESRQTSATRQKVSPSNPSTQIAKTVTGPMPDGHQIFVKHTTIAGIGFQREDAIRFIRGEDHNLEFVSEPDNPADKNAIRIYGTSSGRRFFLGYLPKEDAEQVVGSGLGELVKPRITRVFAGEKGFVEVRLQLVGPKASKAQFDQYLLDKPASAQQKDYLKFFDLPVAKALTAGSAAAQIEAHQASASKEEQAEWEEFLHILSEFEDKDFRDCYDLKKASKTTLIQALGELKSEGRTYIDLSENIDDVVDKVLEIKPDLAK